MKRAAGSETGPDPDRLSGADESDSNQINEPRLTETNQSSSLDGPGLKNQDPALLVQEGMSLLGLLDFWNFSLIYLTWTGPEPDQDQDRSGRVRLNTAPSGVSEGLEPTNKP